MYLRQVMQEWGNARAALLWEYSLPKDFKRPINSDQEMEQFIRNKYERTRVSCGLFMSNIKCLDIQEERLLQVLCRCDIVVIYRVCALHKFFFYNFKKVACANTALNSSNVNKQTLRFR